MLGIEDPMVWLAYVGCIVMAAVCVIYGVIRRNAAADVVTPGTVPDSAATPVATLTAPSRG